MRCIQFAAAFAISLCAFQSSSFSRELSQASAPHANESSQSADDLKGQESFLNSLVSRASAERIRAYHTFFTAEPHVAGTQRSREIALYIAGEFRKAGLKAAIDAYDVMLSYPEHVSLRLTAPTRHKFDLREPGYDDDPITFRRDISIPHFGYSGSGDVEGEVVYVNYGLPEDYAQLNALGVSVEGRIVLARFGRSFRGTKVRLAEEHGAIGVLLYSDPADDGFKRGDVYPDGPWRSERSAQRGSVMYLEVFPGDPLSPGIGARKSEQHMIDFDSDELPLQASEGAIESARAEILNLPKIPALPISYQAASRILKKLDGPPAPSRVPPRFVDGSPGYAVAPSTWQGGLGFTYHVGPGEARVRLSIKMKRETATIYNAIGWLPGATDETIVVGSHHDAWVFGGVDPSAGTAVLTEIARSVGEAGKDGFQPRRILMFVAWDAEEFGLIGSTEFVERYLDSLQSKVAAYFNIDGGATDQPGASASPHLAHLFEAAASYVPSPTTSLTLLERWREVQDLKEDSRPTIAPIASGSDFAAFVSHAGIPAAWLGFRGDYGVYHSNIDTQFWLTKFVDPNYIWQRWYAQWYLAAIGITATEDRLPIRLADYGDSILRNVRRMRQFVERLDQPELLETADGSLSIAERFSKTATEFDACGEAADRIGDRSLIEAWNELARTFDQAFLRPVSQEGGGWYRNILWGPDKDLGVGAIFLPDVDFALKKSDFETVRSGIAEFSSILERQNRRIADICR